jgi:hypothetical protein
LRKKGQFDDQPMCVDLCSWRKWLQTLDAEILRFAQDDNILIFSATYEVQLPLLKQEAPA